MQRFLENMRNLPRERKSHYSFLVAALSTLVIGGIWSLSLSARLSGSEIMTEDTSRSGTEKSEAGFGDFFGSAQEQLGSVFGGFENTEETPADNTVETAIQNGMTDTHKEQMENNGTQTDREQVLIGTTRTATGSDQEDSGSGEEDQATPEEGQSADQQHTPATVLITTVSSNDEDEDAE